MRKLLRSLVCGGLAMGAWGEALLAQDWSGLGADDNWTTPSNWSAPPSNDGTAEISFTGSTRPNPFADAPWSIHSLSANTGTAFVLSGGELSIGTGGISKAGASTFAIQNDLTLTSAQEWTQSGDGALIVSGAIDLGTSALTLDTDSTSAATGVTFSGNIEGSGVVTKTGTGHLTLSGTSTYTTGTAINGGTVHVTDDANLGDATASVLFDGGTLSAGASLNLASARQIGINPGGATLDTSSHNVTIGGPVLGPGKLTKTGSGALTINGASTYQGGTHVQQGNLAYGGPVSVGGLNLKFEMADATSVTFDGTVSGARLLKSDVTTGPSQANVTFNNVATFNTNVAGSSFAQGDLILSGANGAIQFSGLTKQLDLLGLPDSRSRLVIDNASAGNSNRVTDSAIILMFGNSALKFVGNADAGVQETIGATVLGSGITTIEMDASVSTVNGTPNGLVFQSWATGNARAVDNYYAVTDTSGALGQGNENPFIKFNAGLSHNTLISRASYNGTDLLEYGSLFGLRAATSTNTLAGAGTVDDVRLISSQSLAGDQAIRSLAIDGGVTLSGSGTLTVQSGMLLSGEGSELAANISATPAGAAPTIFDARGDTTVSGTLAAAPTFEKWGDGALQIGNGTTGGLALAGAATVVVQEGTLRMGRNNAVTAGAGYYINNGSALDLQSFSLTAGVVVIDEGSSIEGSGLLTAQRLLTSTASFGEVGTPATVEANLSLNGSYASPAIHVTAQTSLAIDGSTSISGGSSPGISVESDASLLFNGAIIVGTNRVLAVNTLGQLEFAGGLSGHGLRLASQGNGEVLFTSGATFGPSSQIANVVGQLQRGTARFSDTDGAIGGLDLLVLGDVGDRWATHRRADAEWIFDNSEGVNSDRLDNGTEILMNGQSTIRLVGNESASVSETIGSLSAGSGETRLAVDAVGGQTATLNIGAITRAADNILLADASGGTLGAGAGNPNIVLGGAADGFLERTIVNGETFAVHDSVNGIQAAQTASSIAAASNTDHVVTTTDESVESDKTLASLVTSQADVDGAGKLTIETGHLMLSESAIANDVETPGDAFVYATGASALSGSVSVAGDFRKAGAGDLSIGSTGKSLAVGSGKSVYVDAGSMTAAADGAIAAGTDVVLRQAVLNSNYNLSLGEVALNHRADILGSGSITVEKLTVGTSSVFVGVENPTGGGITAAFQDAFASVVQTNISGAGDLIVDGRLNLQGVASHTGVTTVDGGLYIKGPGAILESPLIEIGKTSTNANLFFDGSPLVGPPSNRIADSTNVDLYGGSQFRVVSGTTTEQIGDLNIMSGATAFYGGFQAASVTSTDAWSMIVSDVKADAVSIWKDGAETVIAEGQIVPMMLGSNGGYWRPVKWAGGYLVSLAPEYVADVNAGSFSYASVNSAQFLLANQSFDFLEFTSVDPFTSTPGTTLLINTGLFFSAAGAQEKEMSVDVRLTSDNASISSNGVVRFNQALEADGDLMLSGGAEGKYIIAASGAVGGTLTLANGTLVVGEGGTGSLSGNLVVQSGATLEGSGNVSGNVSVQAGGNTAPGNSPGTLTVDGDLTYEFGSYITMELGMPVSDKLVVNGTLTFEGTSLRIVAADGFAAGVYTLFEYENILGFDELEIDFTFGAANNLGFAATLINDTDNSEIVIDITQAGGGSPSTVPEPASLLLLAAGAGLALTRRKR